METPNQCLGLDAATQKGFLKFHEQMPKKQPTTVRIFDRGEFYSVHGKDDSELAANLIYKSTNVIKLMTSDDLEPLKYVSISKANFDNFIRELLLVKSYRLEVYVSSSKSSNNWKIEFTGSPGNLQQFEDILFANLDLIHSNELMSLQVQVIGLKKKLAIACIDSTEHMISVCEFEDNDFFNELEAILVVLSPKECLVPSVDNEYQVVSEVLSRNGILVTQRQKKDFLTNPEFFQDLGKIVRFNKGQQKNIHALPEATKLLAMGCLSAGMKYLNLQEDNANLEQYSVKMLNLTRFVHLDAAAVSALNLFPTISYTSNSTANKWESVYGVLDNCRTAQGKRLMAQWVKQPLRSLELIVDRHDIVESLLTNNTIREDLYNMQMKSLPDILVLNKKLMRRKAGLQDIFKIYQVILRMPDILESLKELDSSAVKNVLYDPLTDSYNDLLNYKSMVEEVLDFESIETQEFLVNANFDDGLKESKEDLDNIKAKMNRELAKASRELGLDSVKLEFVSQHGYHFRVTLKDESELRKSNKYKLLDTARGGARFTSEALTNLNEDFTSSKERYEEAQKDIVDNIIGIAAGYQVPLNNLNLNIAQLDCLLSFAVLASSAPGEYVRPKMHSEDDQIIDLKTLRHPCLEYQDDMTYIANDVHLKHNDTNMYILTGANMGGKSTYIRSVGVAVLLAHIGCYVPCAEAHISMVDSILGRIGADDSIMKGMSTFMVEMVETANILRTATKNSLVIIDELGRGTSTYEGCGIAWSIAEYLAETTKCFTLFATHFHEITALADTSLFVKNYHMAAAADDSQLTLLFKVMPGVMHKSFGIQVAEIANFPNEVVEEAKEFLKGFNEDDLEMEDESVKAIKEFLENMKISEEDFSKDIITKKVEQFMQQLKI